MSSAGFRGLVLGLTVMAAAAPARAYDREFHEIVNRLAEAYHKKPMPFMGFLSFAAHFDEPEGVSGLKMAIFDDVDPALGPDEGELDSLLARTGSNFRPFVKVRSKSGERTYIYAGGADARHGSELLLVTIDPSDAVVIKMRLSADAMKRWVDDPVGHGEESAHTRGRRDSDPCRDSDP